MAAVYRFLLLSLMWIALPSSRLNVAHACFKSFRRCGEGTWTEWGPWIMQSCGVTCCGATQYEARKRDCPKPRRLLCRNFPGCGEGDPIQSRTVGICNEIDCPVSCAGVDPGAYIPDPCNYNNSRYYYRCITRSANATKLECGEGLVFKPNINACFINI